jgi:hypothetical protein
MDVDAEVFGPYIGAMVEEFGLTDTASLKDSATMALEGAGAEEAACAAFVEALVTKLEEQRANEVAAAAVAVQEAARLAALALEESKVLRADREAPSDLDNAAPETEAEQKARRELIKRYEMDCDDSDSNENDDNASLAGQGSGVGISAMGGERKANDNAERVKREEQELRMRRKEEAKIQKDIAKKTGADGKKKREEAKEKRRQKAIKGERKGGKH